VPILLALLLTFGAAAAEGADPIVYKKMEWGSVAAYNPLGFYLNAAFDTAQNPNYFSQEHYFSNHAALFHRVKSPAAAIRERGGIGAFLEEEFFGIRAIPNWTLHIIGGGYDYRYLAEWYEARRVPSPYLMAFLTAYLANIGNEALETTASQVPPTDQIADLFFFDIAGKLLFLNDDVARFFHEELQLRAWGYQPMLTLNDLRIHNAGLNWVARPKWFGESWRPFIHFGLLLLAGITKRISDTDNLSLGVGVTPTDPLAFKGDFVTGVYWDREDSLLASLTLNGTTQLAFRLNVYPGVIRIEDWKVGVFAGYSKAKQVIFGANVSLPFGVGASL
jgi:hypothetical protein